MKKVKVGQTVRFNIKAGDIQGKDAWNVKTSEYNKIVKHDNKTAIVTKEDIEAGEGVGYFTIKFEDGYVLNAVSSVHLSPVSSIKERVAPEYEIGDDVIWTTKDVPTQVLDIIQFKNQIRYNVEFKGKDYYVTGSELEPFEASPDFEVTPDDAKRAKV